MSSDLARERVDDRERSTSSPKSEIPDRPLRTREHFDVSPRTRTCRATRSRCVVLELDESARIERDRLLTPTESVSSWVA